ncbi:MAG: DNA mismatch repair protein MutT [Treponema sp. CETP13]|nr:MAG: DNA mismatch repair protein MutT [Treponema sp. CETP13]
MKRIQVVAAIIIKSGKVFVAQRAHGEYKGFYELPGGKVEPGEKKEDALRREIDEELDTEIAVNNFVETVEYDYPTFHLTMDCYLCSIISGNLTLLEHSNSKFLSAKDLNTVKWLPADKLVVDALKNLLK